MTQFFDQETLQHFQARLHHESPEVQWYQNHGRGSDAGIKAATKRSAEFLATFQRSDCARNPAPMVPPLKYGPRGGRFYVRKSAISGMLFRQYV